MAAADEGRSGIERVGEARETDPLDVLRTKKLLTSADIARALSSESDRWTTRRARKWLRRSQAGFQLGPRGPWVTTRQRLRERFPDVLDLVLLQVEEDGEDLL